MVVVGVNKLVLFVGEEVGRSIVLFGKEQMMEETVMLEEEWKPEGLVEKSIALFQ